MCCVFALAVPVSIQDFFLSILLQLENKGSKLEEFKGIWKRGDGGGRLAGCKRQARKQKVVGIEYRTEHSSCKQKGCL